MGDMRRRLTHLPLPPRSNSLEISLRRSWKGKEGEKEKRKEKKEKRKEEKRATPKEGGM